MLFHLLRGSGVTGLGGMRPVSVQETPTITLRILRPLLCATRQEIEAYLSAAEQPYCHDRTNEESTYTRNRIRHDVLPALTDINPKALSHMSETARQLWLLADFLDAEVEKLEGSVWTREKTNIFIKEEDFLSLHPALAGALLHTLLSRVAGSKKDLSARHILALQGLFGARIGARLHFPYGLRAERREDGVMLFLAEDEAAAPKKILAPVDVNVPGRTMAEGGILLETTLLSASDISEKIPCLPYTKWFDYDKIEFTVQLRGRQKGDFLQVGKDGGHKKLKAYLIEEKIPQSQRDALPLLTDGSHVLWVIGHRISEAYKVTAETKRILQVQVLRKE